MPVTDLAKALGEVFGAGGSARSVFGEPVTSGNRTVIPVASIRYGFGVGGGEKGSAAYGGGGGGGLVARPIGVVEITPEGTRFVPISQMRMVALAALVAFAAAYAATCLLRR
jgi:uncharacterized spore protein YtfJ